MIDIHAAKKVFNDYTRQYNTKDDKIHLKLVHTYGVMQATNYLGKSLNLSLEDFQLAQLIALLHDIGRFEQLKRFQSFDDKNINHAALGVEILESNNFIRQFATTTKYDEIIKTALLNHNTYKIDSNVQGKCLLHCQIIRDADKLDNFRVKIDEKIETLFDISQKKLEDETISSKVLNDFKQHQLIKKQDRKTHLDMWLSYIAFIFDLNFEASRSYIKKENYLPILFKKITPSNQQVTLQMKELEHCALEFIQ